ncbi:MAG: thioredoxin fold domain-containing protein [Thiohalobacterales bacterium]|nr:thioredoxin fold domain-containing protein [Thiohalobacterales bacterium]
MQQHCGMLIFLRQQKFASAVTRALLCCMVFFSQDVTALEGVEGRDYLLFDDSPLEEPLEFPDRFKLSILDLREELDEVRESGKNGLIIYYGQKYCAYCQQFLEKDLVLEDIRGYMLEHYDVIGVDIHGHRMVTDFFGETLNEAQFAIREKTNFTPSVVFYSPAGEEALRLRGYYPPYRFRAALEYVADGHFRREDFRQYLARADVPLVFEPGDLSDQPFFLPGPFMLDRSRFSGEQPLAVFFEQGNCHACDVLHTGPLQDAEIRSRLERMEVVQLGYWSDTPVVTPAGDRTTAKKWAEALGLFYTPTLIFFDTDGSEIIRLDSVVKFYRLRNVLDYILTGGHLEYPTFQRWRQTLRPPVYRE